MDLASVGWILLQCNTLQTCTHVSLFICTALLISAPVLHNFSVYVFTDDFIFVQYYREYLEELEEFTFYWVKFLCARKYITKIALQNVDKVTWKGQSEITNLLRKNCKFIELSRLICKNRPFVSFRHIYSNLAGRPL